MPPNVYDALAASPVTDVHVFGRRGPAQVKFTPLELRELGELRDVDMIVADEDFVLDAASQAAIETNKQVMVINRVLNQWRTREVGSASRRLHLHFWAKPLELVDDGTGRVSAIRYERTEPDGEGGTRGTGEIREIAVQAVYRAVGYFGSPLDGLPFDEMRGVIPNREGQVLDDNDEPVHGVYATGWIKRGPVGLIGHTKSDAAETIAHLLADAPDLVPAPRRGATAVDALLAEKGLPVSDFAGWDRLDAHELAAGLPHGRARVKHVSRTGMTEIAARA